MKMRLTLAAFDDLQDIHWYCSLFNEDYARQTEKELFEQFEVFEQFPQLGAPTDEEDVRRWPMRKHITIFYRIDQQERTVEVLRILYSKRVRDVDRVPRS
jgi:plasmid stabilization system protein ParE